MFNEQQQEVDQQDIGHNDGQNDGQNIVQQGFGDMIGNAQLTPMPELPPGREAAAARYRAERARLRDEEIQCGAEINEWIASCQNTERVPDIGFIRQMSGEGVPFVRDGVVRHDTNDYGARIFELDRHRARIFNMVRGALNTAREAHENKLPFEIHADEIMADEVTQHMIIPDGHVSAAGYTRQAMDHAKNMRFPDAWWHFRLAVKCSPPEDTTVTMNMRLFAEYVLSDAYTEMCIDICMNEIKAFKQYVSDYLMDCPQFHARAWRCYRAWIEEIESLTKIQDHPYITDEYRRMWLKPLGHRKPSKSATMKAPL